MDFGKLTDVSNVDFKLPDPIFFLERQVSENKEKKHLYLGGTGWSHSPWKGQLYPTKTASSDFLYEYGKQFNCIELNTTYYRIPPPELILKWASRVPDDFRFAPKVLQYISLSKKLGTDTDRIERFCESVQYFDKKLGPCFLQLPPHFGTEKLTILEAFIDSWPQSLALSIELRHPGWFGQSPEMELLLSLLSERNIGLVVTDVAGRRDVAHTYFLADHMIVRFGGNFPHDSDEHRLSEWSSLIHQSFEHGLKNFYFFSHQQEAIAPGIVRDLQYLHTTVKPSEKVKSRAPSLIRNQYSLF